MPFAVEEQPASPAGPEERPGFIARGRIRRRVRFLRKARELAYRDLGGLVFNLHRFGQRNDALVLAKLTTLGHIDSELRALERTLREPQPITVLSEAGITACARCAAIHSSEDRYCPNCGLPLHRHADLPADLRTGSSPPLAARGSAPASPAQSAFQSSFGAPVPPAPRSSGPGGAPTPQPTASHPATPSHPATAPHPTPAPPPTTASHPATPTPERGPKEPSSPEAPAGATPAGGTPAGATPAGATPAGDAPATPEQAGAEQADDEATAIVRPPANRQ
jgi:hypothetical protein